MNIRMKVCEFQDSEVPESLFHQSLLYKQLLKTESLHVQIVCMYHTQNLSLNLAPQIPLKDMATTLIRTQTRFNISQMFHVTERGILTSSLSPLVKSIYTFNTARSTSGPQDKTSAENLRKLQLGKVSKYPTISMVGRHYQAPHIKRRGEGRWRWWSSLTWRRWRWWCCRGRHRSPCGAGRRGPLIL